MAKITMREAISQALMEEMDRDPAVFIMGEEVGVWGGTYAVTKGFYDKYGADRVKDTPIAENAIIGAAIGAAMVGQRPVAELMTINFAFSAMDYIVNQAPKLALHVRRTVHPPDGHSRRRRRRTSTRRDTLANARCHLRALPGLWSSALGRRKMPKDC
jgi:pyruvate/2-oxoglutarate/acetoin dehydrogenase E1 component